MIRLMGAEAFTIYDEHTVNDFPRLVDLYKKMGISVCRTSALAGSLAWMSPVGLYGDILMDFQAELRSKGIKHEHMCAAAYNWENSSDFSNGSWKSQVVNNINGEQDIWLEATKYDLSQVMPEVWNLANEISGPQTDIALDTYIDFVIRSIQEYRSVKSDIILAIGGSPFWDLKPLLNAGGIDYPDIVYCMHYYYALNRQVPPSYNLVGNAYWNATTQTDLQNARDMLWSYFDNDAGIALAQSMGKTVWLEEIGAWRGAPNYMQFMRDAFDYCTARKMDFLPFGLVRWDKDPTAIIHHPQMLTDDITDLNEIAYLAMEYMTLPTPPTPPPLSLAQMLMFWGAIFGIGGTIALK